MLGKNISISRSAQKLIDEKGIKDVTFDMKVMTPAGCCVGIIKEIEPEYKEASDPKGYRMYKAGDTHVFVSREIRILGALTLTTEGFWKSKRLALNGATVPL
ncbi:hypothetical protein ACFL2O_09230 [Thermodesulfobacteriota bacterium]